MKTKFIESLEGRTLLSGTLLVPAVSGGITTNVDLNGGSSGASVSGGSSSTTTTTGGGTMAAVKADQLVIKADLLKFQADIASMDATLYADVLVMKANSPHDKALAAPVAQLHADWTAMRMQLLQDRLTQASNVMADEAVIVGDKIQMIADKGNATALAADHTKLHGDRIKLENDMIAGLNTRIATRQSFDAMLKTDLAAIVTAADADTNASAAFQAAVSQFATDANNGLATLAGDLQVIVTARTQLVADLAALG